jgi:hypothetical protein
MNTCTFECTHKDQKEIKKKVQLYANFIERIDDIEHRASNWIFVKVIELQVNVDRYNPIRGSSYIELHQAIKAKQAIINIKNRDDKCFYYSIAAHDVKGVINPDRVSHYKKEIEKYDTGDFKLPMKISDIPKFEKKFNKVINVYIHEPVEERKTEGKDNHTGTAVQFHPLYISENYYDAEKATVAENFINLLLIQEENEDGDVKTHYTYIKSMSRLLAANFKTHVKMSHCPSCFHAFSSDILLIEHLQNGCIKFKEHVKLPGEDEAIDYIKFKNEKKKIPAPFVIYADFESIITPATISTASTEKYGKHDACGYCFYTVSTVPEYNRIYQYRGDDKNQDVAKHFIDEILKEQNRIFKIIDDVKPMAISEQEREDFKNSTVCHICEKKLKDDSSKYYGPLTGKV